MAEKSGFLGLKCVVVNVCQRQIQFPNKTPYKEEKMDYSKGFEQGQLVDQHYNPPTGDEPDEYIEGWVDGRMEQIRREDPETAHRYEQIFLGAEGFGKATYRDMLDFLTADDATIARRLKQGDLQ